MSIIADSHRERSTVTDSATHDLTILYGSQTGNAEYLAHQIHGSAQKGGAEIGLASLEEWLHSGDRSLRRLLVVTSTHDNGHMPDNAAEFWDWINTLEPGAFDGLPYAVLSIGDSMYEDFCKAGHDIDERMLELGAQRVVEGVDCDIDFEFSAMKWAATAVAHLMEAEPWTAQAPASPDAASPSSSTTDGEHEDRTHTARVSASRPLSKPGSAKMVTHYELSFEDGPFPYKPGDSISIIIANPPELVDEWVAVFGDSEVRTGGFDSARPLREVLTHDVELRLPHPGLIVGLARLRPADDRIQQIIEMIQSGRREELDAWLWGRDVLDVVTDLGCTDLPVEDVLDILRPLQHRDYSIASSPLHDDGRVHLTVNGVVYERRGRAHRGAATDFLRARAEDGAPFPVRLVPAHEFRLPASGTPVVMIGPGVGVAPFRAFLQHREATGDEGRNWLFFGDQHRDLDYLYEDEFAQFAERGTLTRLDVAFSRDQANKHYVQHELRANSDSLREWISEGAYVFVCGDKARMAPDVDRALAEILDESGAGVTVAELKASGRYVKDVY